MSKILIILAIIVALLIIIAILAVVIAWHQYFCDEVCPHGRHCKAHENEKDFVPPCYKDQMQDSFHQDTFGL